jgi:hypothetical protein
MVSILTLNKQVCQNFFVIHGPDFPGCKQDLSVYLIGILCRSGGARLGAESWFYAVVVTLATTTVMVNISRQSGLQEDRIAQDTDPRKSLSQR